jgi:ribonucleoside-diphosphate reductase alpha chain
MSAPERTPTLLPAIRVRHGTGFGHIHVTVVIDIKTARELEIFAQIGRAGEQTYSDLEGMCRLASLYLRSGGSLAEVTKQLLGIGSNLSSEKGDKVSVANSLGEALDAYQSLKSQFGLQAMLLGDVPGMPE